MQSIAPGIWRIRLGEPEKITPVSTRGTEIARGGLEALPTCPRPPLPIDRVRCSVLSRGCVVELPMLKDERVYGLGLQLGSFDQTGRKRCLRVNSDPQGELGDSHAPVPFYVSTAGYGVLVDTARYAAFYSGTASRVEAAKDDHAKSAPADNTADLYAAREVADRVMVVDVPAARGVDVYIFAGPSMVEAVQRYNLFSGGGCLPPMWGLGGWYRAYAGSNTADILRLAEYFRQAAIPCDVLGLEPGWQSKAYSCSFVWDKERFPDPEGLARQMTEKGFHPNLWEHVFVHPDSPLYHKLLPHSAKWAVWGGLVPDFLEKDASRVFADYHREQFVDRGISGFKLDECDNSDFMGSPWSFPEWIEFPSGADGEQMHSLLGNLYKRTLSSAFRKSNVRTYGEVRSGHALASPDPYVLYSDLYDHRVFIRGVVNSGFSGLLWTPEVRQCGSSEELVRRMQTAVFSPQMLVNGWMIKNPPWLQYDRDKNNRGEFAGDHKEVEGICRRLLDVRMSLIPYLYASFARYQTEGRPPFRALVMDWPNDEQVYGIDDEYMMGDSLLVAPLTAGQKTRDVYLPEGGWYCFWTHQRYEGGKKHRVEPGLERIPVFVAENTILPLAGPVPFVDKDTSFALTAYAFGESPKDFVLQEDDGVSFDYEKGQLNRVRLTWPEGGEPRVAREGKYPGVRYAVKRWERVR